MVEREPDGSRRCGGAVLTIAGARQERTSRRATSWDVYVVTGALVFLSAVAWWYVGYAAGDDMAVGVLTQPRGDPMAMMDIGSGMALGLFLSTWTVMMVAMMLPATAPVVLLFDRWRRHRNRKPLLTVGFVAGYLAVWTVAGLLFYAALMAIQSQVPNSAAAVRLGGVALLAAGAYQLSPLKTVCLNKCRSPLGFVMANARHLGRGLRGPLRVGVVHGAYCLGCCWALMTVLLVLGLMNVGWMAAVSAVILAEKLFPAGRQVGRGIGTALALAGVAVLATGGLA